MSADEEKGNRKCLVCDSKTANSHLGVDACRACAAFFKRAVVMKKKYVCRQGNGQCRIRKHEPFLCRRCRLDRCLGLGMKLDEATIAALARNMRDDDDEVEAPTNSQSPPVPDTIVMRINKEYKSYCEKRKENELALRISADYRCNLIYAPGRGAEPLYETCIEYETDASPVSNVDLINFIADAFPEFERFGREDKNVVFKNAIGPIWIVECYKLSNELWPAGDGRYFPSGMTGCFDTHNFENFLPENMEEARRRDIVRNMKFYWARNLEIVHPVLRKAHLNEIEFSALFGLLIWSFHNSSKSAPGHIIEIGERFQKEIFADLGRYYRNELQLEDYAARIGEMMSLANAIEETTVLLNEEFRMYRLYDLFKEDSYVSKTWA